MIGDEMPPPASETSAEISHDERTENTTNPTSENVDGETNDAPSKDAAEESDGGSNDTASGPDDESVEVKGSSGSDDAAVDLQTNDARLENVEPKIDEKTSDRDDDGTDEEKAVAEDDSDPPASSIEHTMNGDDDAEDGAEASQKDSDEAGAEPKIESNDSATSADDGDDLVFVDARSSESQEPNDDENPAETNCEDNTESKPEFDAKTKVDDTDDGCDDNGNDNNNNNNNNNKNSIVIDTNMPNLESAQSNDSDGKVSIVEDTGRVKVETNNTSRSESNVSKPMEVTNDDESDRAESLNVGRTESTLSKQESIPAEPNNPRNTDSQLETKSNTKMEIADGDAQNINGETDLDVKEDPDGEDYRTNGDMSDDETHTTYMEDQPLFHYSRIVGSGLPRGIHDQTEEGAPVQRSVCSEFAVVRVDRVELVPSTLNASTGSPARGDISRAASADTDNISHASTSSAADIRNRQREQALLLSSDLWSQPQSIVATGYGGNEGGTITLTHLADSSNIQSSRNSSSSPAVVFATPSTELGVGGIRETSGDGTGSSHKYSNVSTTLHVREEGSRVSQIPYIVDMSFDASGSVLGAVDEGGYCAVWEFKYTTSLQSSKLLFENPSSKERSGAINPNNVHAPDSTPDSERPQVSANSTARPVQTTSMFSNFMSVLTGIPPEDEKMGRNRTTAQGGRTNNDTQNPVTTEGRDIAANDSNDSPMQPPSLVPALTAEILNLSRINYPARWGPPTCLAIDPAYKVKRDKSIAVGFANGQLYLTKKGTFFQRRVDTIIYQAGNRGDKSYQGIETVAWRGHLVAFADVTGIKLIDSIHLSRIAHIARPAGASPFLYPSIRDITPSLFFETAQDLLVGWGDCLMQIQVDEHKEDANSSAMSVQSGGSSDAGSNEQRIKRSATCTMAWELDCVACDIVPLDADHVVVLGLVPSTDGEISAMLEEKNNSESIGHDLEMQILSRKDGMISYSDSLPLLEGRKTSEISNYVLSVRDYRLLSSFALPRMEQYEETKALRALHRGNEMGLVGIDVSFDMNQPLFAGTDSFLKKGIEFKDPHLEWNINSIAYDESNWYEAGVLRSSESDDASVDSDDYECILRPIEMIRPLPSKDTVNVSQNALPPTMVIYTDSEAVLSITSTIDDAIQYSLDNHKYALALYRGIRHKQELRRFSLDDLINYFLEAVLRISSSTYGHDDAKVLSPSLSLRRTHLAIKAMPVLLGDRIELWERWTKELENIPGALFLLRKYLPVRDPNLPSTFYIRILERMLAEVEHLYQNAKKANPSAMKIYTQAAKHFLESLLAWGPTKILKEYIHYYKYSKRRRKGKKDLDDDIRSTEISLQRRYLQTAAGYLIFPVLDVEEELQVSAPRYEVLNADTEDSLFDVTKIVELISLRVPIVSSSDDFGENELSKSQKSYALAPNNHICLEAMARLRMMQGEFDSALKCFLAIGACHSTVTIESFEESAIQVVNGINTTIESSPSQIGDHSYEFVMSLIERHELNQFLFENDFLLSTDSKIFMPIFALIRLVGLRPVGEFLIEHSVAAGFTYNTSLSKMNSFNFSDVEGSIDKPNGMLRRGSLPIDKVAQQLENSPAILYWYLHLVLTRRPDFYIKVPTNSNLSKAVTNLHRKHFELFVDFAGDNRDSSKVLAGIEAYKVASKTTPLLEFLKAALPLGGVMPVETRRALEIERSKDAERDDGNKTDEKLSSSPSFALELAFIIEKYSDETETEAMGVLNLYLKGAKSLPLAVSYAERQKEFTSVLWDHLISHCLEEASDGTIYGELLEAAALTGADLARLVKRIPPGMVVEGLRPRLVAAVADYRMKLEIYEAAMAAGSEEQVTLMREIGHRSRRGLRYDTEKNRTMSFAELPAEKPGDPSSVVDNETMADPQQLSKTSLRRGHKRLVYSIPRR